MGIFGSIFIGVLFYNLDNYKKTKINYLELQNENLKLKIKLKKEENKKPDFMLGLDDNSGVKYKK